MFHSNVDIVTHCTGIMRLSGAWKQLDDLLKRIEAIGVFRLEKIFQQSRDDGKMTAFNYEMVWYRRRVVDLWIFFQKAERN